MKPPVSRCVKPMRWHVKNRVLTTSGVPITSPSFWLDEGGFTEASFRSIFRSETEEEIPLLNERMECLREAGQVLEDASLSHHLGDIC